MKSEEMRLEGIGNKLGKGRRGKRKGNGRRRRKYVVNDVGISRYESCKTDQDHVIRCVCV